MNNLQTRLYDGIISSCSHHELGSDEIVQVMSEVIGYVSRRDYEDAERKREEDNRSGLEKAYGSKADA